MSTAELAPVQQEKKPAPKERLIVRDECSQLMDTARYEQMWRIAQSMARATLIPDHLCMNMKTKAYFEFEQIAGNCLLIVNQAFRWGFDPFAVAPETYVVANKLGFQGKLIAAVINARAGNAEPLGVIYNGGKGDNLAAVIYGSQREIPREAYPLLNRYAKDESDSEAQTNLTMLGVKVIRITVGQAKTDNKMWITDPQQKLFYTGATKWARRHRPELMLGIMTDDDLDRMHHEPPPQSYIESPQQIRTVDQLSDFVKQTALPAKQAEKPAEQKSLIEDESHQGELADDGDQQLDYRPEFLEAAGQGFLDCETVEQVSAWFDKQTALAETDEERTQLTTMATHARARIKKAK